jgi:hypothetical protein
MARSTLEKIFSRKNILTAAAVISIANIGSCLKTQKSVEYLQPIMDIEKLEKNKIDGIKNRSERRIEEADSFFEKVSIKGREYFSYSVYYIAWPGRQVGYTSNTQYTPKTNHEFQNQRDYQNNRHFHRRRY